MNISQQKTLVKAIHSSEKCQRNWDLSRKIPPQHLAIIETALTRCPSKQSRIDYVTYMKTDKDTIHKIYECTNGFITDHTVSPVTTIENSQVCANLLVVLVATDSNDNEHLKRYGKDNTLETFDGSPFGEQLADEHNLTTNDDNTQHKNTFLNVGIAMGYIVLVANQLGYKTGICTCYTSKPIKDALGIEPKDYGKRHIYGLIGIGYPDPKKNPKQHMFKEYTFPSFSKDKKIQVKKI